MTDITIPHKFRPRFYQMPVFKAIDNWFKRLLLVRHRRAWKDKACFNIMVKEALKRVGNYYYIFPTYSQGRKALRDNIDNDWFRTIDHIPEQLIESKNNQEMYVKFKNWSTLNIVGTDGKNIDRLVGTNSIWSVFSEFALSDPRSWSLLRPIKAMNKGRVIFNSTPRWKNHFNDLYIMAKDDPKRFCDILTVEQTGIIDPEILEDERREMDPDLFDQEYMCSFEAAIRWAYYSEQMKTAEEAWRICAVPVDKSLDVYTVWDLWMADSTAIWFYQKYGKEIRCVDYYENSGESLDHYVWVLKSKWYVYWTTFLPHDARVKELSTGKSRIEYLQEAWLTNIEVVPKLWIQEWIDMARRLFPNIYFDKEKCKRGLRCLNEYHKVWDDKNQCFKSYPHHDWSSHWADAFRYLAVSVKDTTQKKYKVVVQDYF